MEGVAGPVEVDSLHERLTKAVASFLDFAVKNYTDLQEGEYQIVVSLGDVYHSFPKAVTFVVDTPTFSASDAYTPNLFAQKQFLEGVHTFLVGGSFVVHVVTKNETLSQRLASLIFLLALAKQLSFAAIGFPDLKPSSIGSTIVLNPEDSENYWYDVPVSFTFTMNVSLELKVLQHPVKAIKTKIAPTPRTRIEFVVEREKEVR